ncbi:12969_t:CDS:2, partial [Gigaspora margarita]
MTIKDFFVKLITGKLLSECNIGTISSKAIEHVELSNTPTTSATQVSLNCNIMEVTTAIGIYVHYHLKTEDTINSNLASQQNSFAILIQNTYRTQLYLPTFQQSGNMKYKQKLHSDIVEWVIWYIDMRGHKKFEDRSYHIPELFLEFFNRASSESYKESRKPFNKQELNLHCLALAPYATSSWMLKENFTTNHTSETPVQTVEQATTIQIHKQNFWVTLIDKTKYFYLEQKPVNIEEFLPTDPVFNSGNNAFNAISIWKIDKQADEEKTLRENNHIISELQAEAPCYHTWAMQINYLCA